MWQQTVGHMAQQRSVRTHLAQAAKLLLLLNVVLGPWLLRAVAVGSVGCSGLF